MHRQPQPTGGWGFRVQARSLAESGFTASPRSAIGRETNSSAIGRYGWGIGPAHARAADGAQALPLFALQGGQAAAGTYRREIPDTGWTLAPDPPPDAFLPLRNWGPPGTR